MKKWVPRGWPDYFEMALTLGSCYSGLIYLLGPDRLRAIYTYVNQFGDGTQGMQVLGVVWLTAGLLQLGSRVLHPRPNHLRRIGHSLAAGAYAMMVIGLVAPIALGGPASSGAAFIPYLLVVMLHVFFGTQEPRLVRRPRNGTREG